MMREFPRALRRRSAVAGVVMALVLLTGCGEAGFSGLYNTPLPGGADLGDDPYRVTVEFADVLDLVPQAGVKVNDVPVGRVEQIELSEDTKHAVVQIVVNGDVRLPANAVAELRQSSLLGEKFVDLRPQSGVEAEGTLADGATIPLERTRRYAELEEVFGALSLLLSGGGVEQLQTIASELNDVFEGNEAEIKALLSRVDHLVTQLDGQSENITKAIEGLNRLSETVVAEQDNLVEVLDHLAPGIEVAAEQRDEIVDMLTALDRLSDVTVDTIGQSRDQMIANLRALEPTLRKLAEAGPDLGEALKILPTYPLPWNAGDTMKGDFANVDAEFDMNLDTLLENMTNTGTPMVPLPTDEAAAPADGPGVELPLVPELPEIALPELQLPFADRGPGALLGSLLGGGR